MTEKTANAAYRASLEKTLKDFVVQHLDIEAGILGARLKEKPGKPISLQVFIDPHYDCQEAHPLPKEFDGLVVTTKVDPMRMMAVSHGYSVSAPHNHLVKRRPRRG